MPEPTSATVGAAFGNRLRASVVLNVGEQVVPSRDELWLVPLPFLWAE